MRIELTTWKVQTSIASLGTCYPIILAAHKGIEPFCYIRDREVLPPRQPASRVHGFWHRTSKLLKRIVRDLNPWPSAWQADILDQTRPTIHCLVIILDKHLIMTLYSNYYYCHPYGIWTRDSALKGQWLRPLVERAKFGSILFRSEPPETDTWYCVWESNPLSYNWLGWKPSRSPNCITQHLWSGWVSNPHPRIFSPLHEPSLLPLQMCTPWENRTLIYRSKTCRPSR